MDRPTDNDGIVHYVKKVKLDLFKDWDKTAHCTWDYLPQN